MNEIQKSYLLETAKWQKFLGIVIAVCTVLIAVAGIILTIFGFSSEPSDIVVSQNPPSSPKSAPSAVSFTCCSRYSITFSPATSSALPSI